jgi:hypothetical protein
MNFDPDAYLASKAAPSGGPQGFDPDSYLAVKAGGAPAPAAPGTPPPGYLESLARGAGQGVSLGFADEIAGAGGAGVDALQKGSLSDVVADYIANRDKYRQGDAAAEAANPKTFLAGNIGGGLATAAIPGLNIGRAATLGGRVAGAAGLGALAAAGGSHADLTQGDVGGLARDAAIGAGTGAILQRGMETIPGLLSGETAENLAVRHLRPTAQTARALGPDKLRDIGREALDSGSIKFGGTVGETAAALADHASEAGALKGEILGASTAQASPFDIAQRFKDEVIDPLRGTEANKDLVSSLEKKMQGFLEEHVPDYAKAMAIEDPEARGAAVDALVQSAPKAPIQNIEAEKMAVQNNINYKTDPNSKTGAMRNWGSILRDEAEKGVNDEGFDASKRAFGNLREGQKMAERTGGLADGGNGLMGHITDVGLGTEAMHLAATGNPAGLAIGAGRAATKGRVASSAAVAADMIAKGAQGIKGTLEASDIIQKLQGIPGAAKFASAVRDAAMRGQGALATTHFLLSQTEPDYQQAIQQGQ